MFSVELLNESVMRQVHEIK